MAASTLFGLNEALLRRLRSAAPAAEVVLNFGGRVGLPVLLALFRANGYQPEVLQSRIVRQDAGTDISFFVALERALVGTGFEDDFACAFSADPDGAVALSACEAQALLAGDPGAAIYHGLHVIRGRPAFA